MTKVLFFMSGSVLFLLILVKYLTYYLKILHQTTNYLLQLNCNNHK